MIHTPSWNYNIGIFGLLVTSLLLLAHHLSHNWGSSCHDRTQRLCQARIDAQSGQITGETIRRAMCRIYDRANVTDQRSAVTCCSPGASQSPLLELQSWFACMRQQTRERPEFDGKTPGMIDAPLSTRYADWLLDRKPPEYSLPSHYYLRTADHVTSWLASGASSCKVARFFREQSYHLLRYWMAFAAQHGIVWWITYGTLLGSMRDGDFIPYDHDVDVAVLDAYEPLIRSLATHRRDFDPKNINLITRVGNFCDFDRGLRLDCAGWPVFRQVDRCAFCTPLARLLTDRIGFLDVFVTRLRPGIVQRTSQPHDQNETGIVRLDLQDVAVDQDRGRCSSYPATAVLPLHTCPFMGLRVPCPREAHTVLRNVYGPDFMTPHSLCDPRTGEWVKQG